MNVLKKAMNVHKKAKKGNKYNVTLYSKFAHNYARLQSKLDHNRATNPKSAATKENDKYNFLSYPKLLTVASDYIQNCTTTVLQSPYLTCFENCFKSQKITKLSGFLTKI